MKYEGARIIGIKVRTTNKDNQAMQDIAATWEKFMGEEMIEKIPKVMGVAIFSVYTEYESDYTAPYTYFLGCQAPKEVELPEGMSEVFIYPSEYKKYTAKGPIPQCVVQQWEEIWKSDDKRKYKTDFEVFDERSKDNSDGEVDIYIGLE